MHRVWDSQKIIAMPTKTQNPKKRPWIKQFCLWGKKKKEKRKILQSYTPSTTNNQFLPQFHPKRKNWEMRKKESQTGSKKLKKQEKSKNKQIN